MVYPPRPDVPMYVISIELNIDISMDSWNASFFSHAAIPKCNASGQQWPDAEMAPTLSGLAPTIPVTCATGYAFSDGSTTKGLTCVVEVTDAGDVYAVWQESWTSNARCARTLLSLPFFPLLSSTSQAGIIHPRIIIEVHFGLHRFSKDSYLGPDQLVYFFLLVSFITIERFNPRVESFLLFFPFSAIFYPLETSWAKSTSCN